MRYLLTLLLLLTMPAFADRVIDCHDGDTCRLERQGMVYKARFAGIDAPELKQPGGTQARDYLLTLIADKYIDADCKGTSWDRQTCTLYVSGQNINALMVQAGWAWDYREYSKGRYANLQAEAQRQQLGLWSNPHISPYCHRHRKKPKCIENRQYQP